VKSSVHILKSGPLILSAIYAAYVRLFVDHFQLWIQNTLLYLL